MSIAQGGDFSSDVLPSKIWYQASPKRGIESPSARTAGPFAASMPTKACERTRSGIVVFDGYEEKNDNGRLETRHFEVKFRGEQTESANFMVDCFAPCA